MKKRRVLALFLALSMALSSNGFTALAAGEDTIWAAETDLSEKVGESVNSAPDANDEIGNGNGASDGSGENGNGNGAEDGSGENGNGNGAADGSDENGNGNDAADGSGESGNGNGAEDGSDENGNGNDAADGSGENGNGNGAEDGSDETEDGNGAADGSDAEDGSDATEETDGTDADIDDAEAAEEVQIDAEPMDNAEIPVRMCTFTDETGMTVTYDQSEEEQYKYTVTDGELTKVTKGKDSDDNDIPVSGVVALKQPGTNDDYAPFNTIAASVFKGNEEITYVILPEAVRLSGEAENKPVQMEIKSGAFEGCKELKGIKLPSNLKAIEDNTFKDCTKLTQLSIPKAVTSIGDSAFEGDTGLFMVYIKDSAYSKMTSIGDRAFSGCERLEKFGTDTDFILPGYLETIGAYAFASCQGIKKVILPDTLIKKSEITDSNGNKVVLSTALGEGAFSECIGLTDVTLSGMLTIPEDAFSGCINLLSVTFANGNTKIGARAFKGCSRLGEARLSNTIREIDDEAFARCTKLRYVDIPYAGIKFGIKVFPNNQTIWMRAFSSDELEEYLDNHKNIRFIAYSASTSEYFLYEYMCLTDKSGKVDFFCSDKETDPNAKNNKKGVKAGEKIYVFIKTTSSVRLVEGSLRCNGTPIGKDKDGDYMFTMPVGGAYVTAEFESTGKDEKPNLIGAEEDIECELSNGNTLKVGQTSRMFLIDTSTAAGGSVVDSSKITFESTTKTVATVSADGTIKALKKGKTYVSAIAYDRNGDRVYREELITVEEADVEYLRLKPYTYDTKIMKTETKGEEVTGIYLKKAAVENAAVSFTLLATAYDEYDDNMSVALKWSTSDSKVAKLAKTSTSSAESQNTITIPAGASGEAVITATATNAKPTGTAKKTVPQKFFIRVTDDTPRLKSSALILNPYQNEGVTLEIICAYGNDDINLEKVALRRQNDKELPSQDFNIKGLNDNEFGRPSYKFLITSKDTDIPDGTKQVWVYVEFGENPYYLPLTIKVKRNIPNPKVSFAKNQAKVNLFYQNGGTDTVTGEGVVVKPIISNLGNAEIESYRLENLSDSGDNAYFCGATDAKGVPIPGNFDIDTEDGSITRTNNKMHYTSKNKPVVTGNLVLTFKGYKEGVNEKKYKITIPTKTTKPSYKLERTSDTFNPINGPQDVELSLLDTKIKNKDERVVDLNDGSWSVELDSSSATAASNASIGEDGKIHMMVNPDNGAGKVVLSLHNDEWDEGQVLKYKYTVKVSSKKLSFKLSKSSVTLNRYFAGYQTECVDLKANCYGVEIPENREFEPVNYEKLSADKQEQYDGINVEWDAGLQKVTASLRNPVKKGSYKFVCYPCGEENSTKVTLTVKVTGAAPSLSLKGSASLNLNAGSADTAELTVNIKNLPSDCNLDGEATAGSIEYVTKKESEADFDSNFVFNIEDNKLKIALSPTRDDIAAKTYTFQMTPAYENYDNGGDEKPVKFKVKVYSKAISVSLKAKGKLNLLERYDVEDAETGAGTNPGTGTTGGVTGSASVADTAKFVALSTADAAVGTGGDVVAIGDAAGAVSDAAVADDTAVPSFGGEENPDGSATTEPDATPDDDETKQIPVEYEYTEGHEDHVTVELTKDNTLVDDNTAISVTSNVLTAAYVFTATETEDGHAIKSIKAYATPVSEEEGENTEGSGGTGGTESGEDAESVQTAKSVESTETDWSLETPIVTGNVNAAGQGELTISNATGVDFADITGITIVIESEETQGGEDPDPGSESFTVTISPPIEGVDESDSESIKYAVIDKDAANGVLFDETATTYINYSNPIPSIESGKNIALMITPEDGWEITSVTAVVTPAESEEGGSENISLTGDGEENKTEYDLAPVSNSDGTVTVWRSNEITADTTFTIIAEEQNNDEDGKPVTFVRNTKHTVIQKDADPDSVIDEGTTDTTTATGYSFVIAKGGNKGYDVEAEVYDTEEYGDGMSLEGIDPIAGAITSLPAIPGKSDDTVTYTIDAVAIEDVSESGITIVVTDRYPVTIETSKDDEGNSKVTGVGYKVVGKDDNAGESSSTDTGYTPYNEVSKPEVTYGKELAIQFKVAKNEIDAEGSEVLVKLTDSERTDVELTPLDSVAGTGDDSDKYIYTIENIEITDTTEINISVETMHTVKLPDVGQASQLAGKVESIKYAVVAAGTDVDAEAAEVAKLPADSFKSPAGDSIKAGDGKLALMVTLSDAKYKVKSFTDKDDHDIAFKEVPDVAWATALVKVYLLDAAISDGMEISINVAEVYTVTFEEKGSHAVEAICRYDETTSGVGAPIGDNKTDEVEKGSAYKFIVKLNSGYSVDVAASYVDGDGETHDIDDDKITYVTDETDATTNAKTNTYTIPAGEIKGNIKVVITDKYTVTVDGVSGNVATDSLKYSVGEGADLAYDQTYSDTNKPTVLLNGSVSIKFTPAAGKTIVALDGEGNLQQPSGGTENEPIYTFAGIDDNTTITISAAYVITSDITTDEYDRDTAKIIYQNKSAQKNANGSYVVLPGSALTFKVEAEPGYDITSVGYKLTAAAAEGGTSGGEQSSPEGEASGGEAAAQADTSFTELTPDSNGIYTISTTDITGDITIGVTTTLKDADNYIVKIAYTGATVSGISEGITVERDVENKITTVKLSRAEGLPKTFNFSVATDTGKKLRYVGTDKDGVTPSSEISKPAGDAYKDGEYTFTLPDKPLAETIVYVKASEPYTDLKVKFEDPSGNLVANAGIFMVTKVSGFGTNDINNKVITKTPVSTADGYAAGTYTEDGEAFFTIEQATGYSISNVKVNGEVITPTNYTEVYVGDAATSDPRDITIYTLSLENKNIVGKEVTVVVSVSEDTQGGGDEPDTPSYGYNLKNCIIYTPVLSGLKDTVTEARIYDVTTAAPNYDSDQSKYFNVEVVNGLLYVMPREDRPEEDIFLENNKTYSVRIWLAFEKYKSDVQESDTGERGLWVAKTLQIKTSQILPKVTTDTNALDLYQSNTDYDATFVVRLKDGSIGELEDITFGEKDDKAKDSFNLDSELQSDGSLKVTMSLNGSSLYAAGSTNKIKMYVRFKNQAKNTAGTAITMTVKINK